jgi:hypothetical protein
MGNTKSAKIILSVIALLIVAGASYYLGAVIGGKTPLLTLNKDNTYQAGWDAAVEKINYSNAIYEPKEVNTIFGEITAINGNTITLKAEQTVKNPLLEQAPEERIITVTADTKFVKREKKTTAELEKDHQDFLANCKVGQPCNQPVNFKDTAVIKLSDLKPRDMIQITSLGNIKMAEDLTASNIILLSSYTPPPAS